MQPTPEKRFVRLESTPTPHQHEAKPDARDKVLDLTIDHLEERIAPRAGQDLNHNESLLIEPLEERIAPREGSNLNHNETMLDV